MISFIYLSYMIIYSKGFIQDLFHKIKLYEVFRFYKIPESSREEFKDSWIPTETEIRARHRGSAAPRSESNVGAPCNISKAKTRYRLSLTVSIAVSLKFASATKEAASDNWCARPAWIVVDIEWWASIPSSPSFTMHVEAKWSNETPLSVRCYIPAFYSRVRAMPRRAASDILTDWIPCIF